MEYIVKTINDMSQIDSMEKAMIDKYVWGNEYTPEAYAQLAIIKDQGIGFKLTCFESDPKTSYMNYGDPVYTDSCLEFFAAYNNNSPLYVNTEMNSCGAALIGIRTDRHNKRDVSEIITPPTIKAIKTSNFWTVEGLMPFESINALFGETEFSSGYKFKGNFYKCGDATKIPHYGMWSPIGTEKPDFHRPEYFGTFIVE